MSETQDNQGNSFVPSRAFLSAEELFKCRKRENLSVPQRGGAKDFEPDGSWLQAKRLEAFYEEECSVLAEFRVEKSGNLVRGTWNAELQLVNIEKTAKFWMKMGFADQHRNWLHPEEALFLMETNCLIVSHNGLELSTQEAYGLFLAPATEVTIEEYQVYCHLRRLGYIVIRHAGKLDLTIYEKQIGLDRHVKKKKQRQKKGTASTDTDSDQKGKDCSIADLNTAESVEDNKNLTGEKTEECDGGRLQMSSTSSALISTQDLSGSSLQPEDDAPATNTGWKRKVLEDGIFQSSAGADTAVSAIKKMKSNKYVPTQHADSSLSEFHLWTFAASESLSRNKDSQRVSLPKRTFTSWDYEAIKFPDIAGKDTVAIAVQAPDLLPPNTAFSEEFDDVCMFDVEEYRNRQHNEKLAHPHRTDRDTDYGRLKDLQFSYAEWMKENSNPIIAKNWGEWKAAMQERNQASCFESPVSHLWRGEVTPLVQPSDSTSTAALLRKLSIIKPFQDPVSTQLRNKAKIVYDVYLPNTTFRKTSPGLPDHRLCVVQNQPPPDFFQVQSATAHLEDNVPLHWAVVSSGEISFFIFENSLLPVHVSSLG